MITLSDRDYIEHWGHGPMVIFPITIPRFEPIISVIPIMQDTKFGPNALFKYLQRIAPSAAYLSTEHVHTFIIYNQGSREKTLITFFH